MSKFYEIISSESIMNKIRLLCLVMAICFASGAKAQFYDRADEIYYYVASYDYLAEIRQVTNSYGMRTLQWEKTGRIVKHNIEEGNKTVMVFNFDGKNAADLTVLWNGESVYDVKQNLQKNPSYYEEKVETTEYKWIYSSSSYRGFVQSTEFKWKSDYAFPMGTIYVKGKEIRYFSPDRETMIVDRGSDYRSITFFKRVDKSFFKVGRSRTPSGTLHE